MVTSACQPDALPISHAQWAPLSQILSISSCNHFIVGPISALPHYLSQAAFPWPLPGTHTQPPEIKMSPSHATKSFPNLRCLGSRLLTESPGETKDHLGPCITTFPCRLFPGLCPLGLSSKSPPPASFLNLCWGWVGKSVTCHQPWVPLWDCLLPFLGCPHCSLYF